MPPRSGRADRDRDGFPDRHGEGPAGHQLALGRVDHGHRRPLGAERRGEPTPIDAPDVPRERPQTGDPRSFGETETGEARLENAVAGLLSTMQDGMLVFANTWNGFRRFEPGSSNGSARPIFSFEARCGRS